MQSNFSIITITIILLSFLTSATGKQYVNPEIKGQIIQGDRLNQAFLKITDSFNLLDLKVSSRCETCTCSLQRKTIQVKRFGEPTIISPNLDKIKEVSVQTNVLSYIVESDNEIQRHYIQGDKFEGLKNQKQQVFKKKDGLKANYGINREKAGIITFNRDEFSIIMENDSKLTTLKVKSGLQIYEAQLYQSSFAILALGIDGLAIYSSSQQGIGYISNSALRLPNNFNLTNILIDDYHNRLVLSGMSKDIYMVSIAKIMPKTGQIFWEETKAFESIDNLLHLSLYEKSIIISHNSQRTIYIDKYTMKYSEGRLQLALENTEVIELDRSSSPHDIKITQNEGLIFLQNEFHGVLIDFRESSKAVINSGVLSYHLDLSQIINKEITLYPVFQSTASHSNPIYFIGINPESGEAQQYDINMEINTQSEIICYSTHPGIYYFEMILQTKDCANYNEARDNNEEIKESFEGQNTPYSLDAKCDKTASFYLKANNNVNIKIPGNTVIPSAQKDKKITLSRTLDSSNTVQLANVHQIRQSEYREYELRNEFYLFGVLLILGFAYSVSKKYNQKSQDTKQQKESNDTNVTEYEEINKSKSTVSSQVIDIESGEEIKLDSMNNVHNNTIITDTAEPSLHQISA